MELPGWSESPDWILALVLEPEVELKPEPEVELEPDLELELEL